MLKIIDNIIPERYQDSIEELMLGSDFPWYHLGDVTFPSDIIPGHRRTPAAQHLFVEYGKPTSSYFDFLKPMIIIASQIADIEYRDIDLMRSFLQYPLNPKMMNPDPDPLHVDNDAPHTVLLYYVNDSEGDTLITDTRKGDGPRRKDLKVRDHNVVRRVTPKKGRAVIFDGDMYHTAEQPETKMRCIINTNLIK